MMTTPPAFSFRSPSQPRVCRALAAAFSGAVLMCSSVAFAQLASPATGTGYFLSGHRLWKVDLKTQAAAVVAGQDGFSYPGDLAVAGNDAWVLDGDGEIVHVSLTTGAMTHVVGGLEDARAIELQPTPGGSPPDALFVLTPTQLLRVDLATTTVQPVVTLPLILPAPCDFAFSLSGQTIFVPGRNTANQPTILEVDLATGLAADRAGSSFYDQFSYFGDPEIRAVAVGPVSGRPYALIREWGSACYLWRVESNGSAIRLSLDSMMGNYQPRLIVNADESAACAVAGDGNWFEIPLAATPPIPHSVLGFNRGFFSVARRGSKIYLGDFAQGQILVDDLQTNAQSVVSESPLCLALEAALAIAPGAAEAFVAEGTRGQIKAVNLATGTSRTLTTGLNRPQELAFEQGGTKLWAAGWSGGGLGAVLHRIDVATGNVERTIPCDGLSGLAIAPDGSTAFLGGMAGLWRVALAPGNSIPPQLFPGEFSGLALDGDGAAIWGVGRLPSTSTWWLNKFPLGTAIVSTVASLNGYDPVRVAVPSGGRFAYVTAWPSTQHLQQRLLALDLNSPAQPPVSLLSSSSSAVQPLGSEFSFVVFNSGNGTNVAVTPVDTTSGDSPVTLTFDSVTGPGDTTLTTSDTGPAVPAGFQILGGGQGLYYEIATTATFSGQVDLCIHYPEPAPGVDETTLQLLHWENGQWTNVTTTRDPATNRIFGVTSSFSPFVVVEWPAMNKLSDLINRVARLDVRHGIIVSLDAKLFAAQQALLQTIGGNTGAAVNCLQAFVQEVQAQRGQRLPVPTADSLIADAQAIITALLGS